MNTFPDNKLNMPSHTHSTHTHNEHSPVRSFAHSAAQAHTNTRNCYSISSDGQLFIRYNAVDTAKRLNGIHGPTFETLRNLKHHAIYGRRLCCCFSSVLPPFAPFRLQQLLLVLGLSYKWDQYLNWFELRINFIC